MDYIINGLYILGLLFGVPLLIIALVWMLYKSWNSGRINATSGGIALAVALGIGVLFWLSGRNWSGVNLDIIVSVAILLALAAGALLGKFGTAGKLTLVIVGALVVFLGPTGAFSLFSNVQGTAKEVVKGDIKLSLPLPEPAVRSTASTPKPLNPEFHLNLEPGERSNFIRVDCNQKIRFWDRDNITAVGTFKVFFCELGGRNCQEWQPGVPAKGARVQFEGAQEGKVTHLAYSLIYVGEQNCR